MWSRSFDVSLTLCIQLDPLHVKEVGDQHSISEPVSKATHFDVLAEGAQVNAEEGGQGISLKFCALDANLGSWFSNSLPK